MNETKVPENRAYKVTLILLLGLAAFSTAMKELNRLHEMVSSVQEFTRQWHGTGLTTDEKPVSPRGIVSTQEIVSTNASCPNDIPSVIGSSEISLSNRIAAATDGYLETMDCDTLTKPEVGGRVDLNAGKRSNRNLPQFARAKFAPVRSLKEEVSSIRPDNKWPVRFEYRTLDRSVTLELPLTMVSDLKGDSFENEISSDFVRGLLGKIDRKHSHGKTETRRRELMIKRFERSINSRRAS